MKNEELERETTNAAGMLKCAGILSAVRMGQEKSIDIYSLFTDKDQSVVICTKGFTEFE
jgi:hypothetical protein